MKLFWVTISIDRTDYIAINHISQSSTRGSPEKTSHFWDKLGREWVDDIPNFVSHKVRKSDSDKQITH